MNEIKTCNVQNISLEQFFSMLDEENEHLSWRDKIKNFEKLMAYYKCAMMEIETKFNVLNEQFSLQHDRNPISSIKTRIKSPESILKKLSCRNLQMSVASMEKNINDIAGVRVICSFTQDVYTLADALLSQDDIELVEIKDYIKNPKDNGYRSLHLIVAVPIFLVNEKRIMNVEIQLRTLAMDSWASLEHQLKYKKDIVFTEEMENELKRCAYLTAELDKKMDELRESVRL
ncbi:MAG: GTP pyrophosphokinase family protein [Ruminococcaceae bacterium]|nr:GTP pyrophosphokinase family protein [Oscillospiraceae bacterium]